MLDGGNVEKLCIEQGRYKGGRSQTWAMPLRKSRAAEIANFIIELMARWKRRVIDRFDGRYLIHLCILT